MVNGLVGDLMESSLFNYSTPFQIGTVTPPEFMGGEKDHWRAWEIPIHAFSNFFTPLLIYAINCAVFDEKAPPEKQTASTGIKQHLRHAIECSISLWFWCSLLLNVQRTEPDMTTAQCFRNLVFHFFMSDALFYWTHYCCHQKSVYEVVHKQHHTHKATPGAEIKMNALSGTCVSFLDMVIIGHIPAFAPCLLVPLPWNWMIGYVVFLNTWISLLHCVGSKTNLVPNLNGVLVHPHDHAAHHKYGRENVNYGILTTFWDRIMGTHQAQDPENFFFIGRSSSRQPQQQLLKKPAPLSSKKAD
jgi:sterol desaturase/sphingolipid hydroxylase (fatty acid hydroxylase superfamily)